MGATEILALSTLLKLLLFHIPSSSANCEDIICRADNYYWLELDHNGGLTFPAPESKDWECKIGSWPLRLVFADGSHVYLARFHSSDGNIHVTTVQPDGSMALTDHMTKGKVELLMHVRSSNDHESFKFYTVWPRTTLSKNGKKSPDLREAAVVAGIEKNRFIYLGLMKVEGKSHVGKVIQNESGEYELIYHVGQIQRRTEDFKILVLHSCGVILENS